MASLASAEEQPEIHIYSNGDIHLTKAELFSKHALNLYTIRAWNLKWLVPIELGYTKLESAYGVKIDAGELKEGDSLEIKGKFIITKSHEFKIEPTLILDLSIKTREPSVSQPTPVIIQTPQATGEIIPPPSSPSINKGGGEGVGLSSSPQNTTSKLKLTMTLKPGFWGGQVKTLQKFLKKQGYFPKEEPTSRYFGDLTKKALSDFQTANALEATGTLGPKTRALINSLIGQ